MNTIHLYGDIGSTPWSEGISAKDVVLALKELSPEDEHFIRINSAGGMVDEGLAIMNVLLAHKRTMQAFNPSFKLHTVCDGYAMSAATCPFMAGDIRTVALGGVIMIHDAWSYGGGNSEMLRKIADDLEKLSTNAADIYATLCTPKASRTSAFFRSLMKDETYFIGDEALDNGLATNVDKNSEAVLSANLTPEKLKGHYIEQMTTKRIVTTLKRPVDAAALQERKKAYAMLDKVIAELS